MQFLFVIFMMALSAAIGSLSTWIFLMNRYAGRPVDWATMGFAFAMTAALLGALLHHPL
jgi:hypothetical protein